MEEGTKKISAPEDFSGKLTFENISYAWKFGSKVLDQC